MDAMIRQTLGRESHHVMQKLTSDDKKFYINYNEFRK